MNPTRRGFLATSGAAAAGDIARAQDKGHGHDHGHDHQLVPSDPTLRANTGHG
jgi:hypothetical protein